MPAKTVSINLLGEKGADKSPIGRIATWAITYGRYIMIGTEIVVLLAFISRFSLDRKLTDLKEEIDQKQAIIEANQSLEQDVKNVQDKLAKIKTIYATGILAPEIVASLQTTLPPGVYLDTLEISATKVVLKGSAGTNGGFSQFLSKLQSDTTYTNIEVGDIRRDPLKGIVFDINLARPNALKGK